MGGDIINVIFDKTALQAIAAALKRGDRVELIPVKDGVKIMQIRREEINKKSPE